MVIWQAEFIDGVNDLIQKQQLSRRERASSGNQQVGLKIAGLAHDPAPVIDAVSIFQDYPGGEVDRHVIEVIHDPMIPEHGVEPQRVSGKIGRPAEVNRILFM